MLLYFIFNNQVLIVDDNVAIIFKNSERSKKLLPGLVPNEAAAICLGRFAQEPLAEYCSIWTSPDSSGLFGSEAFHLSLHPLQVDHLFYIFYILYIFYYYYVYFLEYY